MDKIKSLNTVIKVVESGGFTMAADQLGISRLQVTRHVQDIEDWLNLRLFHRTTRKVSLTNQGQEVLEQCHAILRAVSDLEHHAQSYRNELVGNIRIASPIGVGQGLVLDAVDKFISLHTGVTVQMILSDDVSHLVDESVDIALRYSESPEEYLIARKLMYIESVLCASPEYLNAAAALNEPSDLKNHNCLVHTSSPQWKVCSFLGTELIQATGNIKTNEMNVLVKAAIRHLGIANLPCDLANEYLRNGQLVEVLPHYFSPGSHLWAVYLSRRYQNRVVRSFIDFLSELWDQDITKQ